LEPAQAVNSGFGGPSLVHEILLATRSPDKAGEITDVIASTARVRLVTLKDLSIAPNPAEDDVERYDTFLQNALAKARYFYSIAGRAVLADDSGLMVDALDGLPGVRTKRFAADHGVTTGNVDEANNDLLLAQLREVPDGQRGAQYVCAAVLIKTGGEVVSSIGTCTGMIARERRGDGGFGYDPLFHFPELGVTFAELTRTQKNAYSHRAKAFRALAPHLK
jgi:XTP/dITP diphosphohydrolase